MAKQRVKVWSQEVLESADLNAEFDNILTNSLELITPVTADFDLNGKQLILDSDGDTSVSAQNDDVIDLIGKSFPVLRVDASAASPVNGLTLTPGAAGGAVSLVARGSDTDVDINITPKGVGAVQLGGVDLARSCVNASTSASPGSIPAGTDINITFSGLAVTLGDFVHVSFSTQIDFFLVKGAVTAAGIVLVTMHNSAAVARDPGTFTVYIRVIGR